MASSVVVARTKPDGIEYLAFGAPNTDNKDAEVVQNWWED